MVYFVYLFGWQLISDGVRLRGLMDMGVQASSLNSYLYFYSYSSISFLLSSVLFSSNPL